MAYGGLIVIEAKYAGRRRLLLSHAARARRELTLYEMAIAASEAEIATTRRSQRKTQLRKYVEAWEGKRLAYEARLAELNEGLIRTAPKRLT